MPAFFLDYDGTLTPIVDNPFEARLACYTLHPSHPSRPPHPSHTAHTTHTAHTAHTRTHPYTPAHPHTPVHPCSPLFTPSGAAIGGGALGPPLIGHAVQDRHR